ncbi:MAG TPA: ABC transporter permease [Spirochaetia bacterium]|nr:ABC transporter permease [Spirochaetia bacterium]
MEAVSRISTRSQIWKGIQPLLGLVVIYVVFAAASGTFRTLDTAETILTQAVILGTMAAGPTIVLISGGLDLSIGSLFALEAVVIGLMLNAHFPVALVVVLALVFGALCGTLNGAITVGTGIPAFIGTLGMMKVYRGIAELLGANQDMSKFPESFQAIGTGYLVPISIMVVCFLLVYVFLSRTRLGFNCYAIGGSNEVSRLAGVPVKRYYLVYYTIGGFFAAVSALILAARLNFTNTSWGNGMELDAIAAVIIGGTSLSGGVGGIGRTVIGVLIVTTLNTGLSHLGVSSSWQRVSIGIVIIFAVWLDVFQRRRELRA